MAPTKSLLPTAMLSVQAGYRRDLSWRKSHRLNAAIFLEGYQSRIPENAQTSLLIDQNVTPTPAHPFLMTAPGPLFRMHHHTGANARWGVSSPLWDWVFGTMGDPPSNASP